MFVDDWLFEPLSKHLYDAGGTADLGQYVGSFDV